jgi:hypothetical protein
MWEEYVLLKRQIIHEQNAKETSTAIGITQSKLYYTQKFKSLF